MEQILQTTQDAYRFQIENEAREKSTLLYIGLPKHYLKTSRRSV
jgi:hypothetical protein